MVFDSYIRILYFHVPVLDPYMIPTMQYLKFEASQTCAVIDIVTPPGRNRMSEGLKENWNTGYDLVIFGQDNVCVNSQLLDLMYCPQPICAIPCLMYPRSTAREMLYQNQISDGKLHDANSTVPWCTGIMGTGISKINLDVQKRIDLSVIDFHHQNFDATLSKLFHAAGYDKFHLHYPLHIHTKM